MSPTDHEQIADALIRLLKDNELYVKLQDASLIRKENFSWKMTAEQTIRVYEEAWQLSNNN